MQVTKCDRCGAIYQPTRLAEITVLKQDEQVYDKKNYYLNCSRLVMTNRNKDYDLCEKCTEEILASFKGE